MGELDKRNTTSPINGKKGGVKSDEGKAISSQNSLKHGILAKYLTALDDMSFEEAYSSFAEEFGDSSPSRKVLIAQLAILHIRIRRCARFECEYIREKLNPPQFEKKVVRQGLDLGDDCFNTTYEMVQSHAGEPMTLDPGELSGLENVYTKYETQFLSRFCTIIEILKRSTEK